MTSEQRHEKGRYQAAVPEKPVAGTAVAYVPVEAARDWKDETYRDYDEHLRQLQETGLAPAAGDWICASCRIPDLRQLQETGFSLASGLARR